MVRFDQGSYSLNTDKTVSRGVVKVMFSADCNSYNEVWVFVYEQKRISIT